MSKIYPSGSGLSQIKLDSYVVKGKNLDYQTRCEHWHSPLDVVAFRFPGDLVFYPCYLCYQYIHGRLPIRWKLPQDYALKVILCGNCHHVLSIQEYLDHQHACANCKHPFNLACAKHKHLYFSFQRNGKFI